MQVVILAGGLATRLGELTKNIPKSLMPIAGKPFIDYQLALLAQAGVDDVILCIGHLGDQVRKHCAGGKQFGLRIRYSPDGQKPLGTGGALRNAKSLLSDTFFVMYGDSYLPCDYNGIWNHFANWREPGLMTVYENNNKFDRSNVVVEGDHVKVYDKKNATGDMRYIDYGLSLFRREVFNRIPSAMKTFDLSDLHRALIEDNQLLAYKVFTRFYEIGSIEGIRELEHLIKNGKVRMQNTSPHL